MTFIPKVTISRFRLWDMPYETLKINVNNEQSAANLAKKLVLVIPGNPGLVQYYEVFAKYLFNMLNRNYNVWVVSHSNFCLDGLNPGLEHRSILERECDHKLKFIEHHITRETELILVGHSIGCYMIMNMLDKLNPGSEGIILPKSISLYKDIKHCFMLFPTIQNMIDSPNGKKLSPVFNYLQGICCSLAYLISKLPISLREWFAKFFIPSGVDNSIVEATVSLITPQFVKSMLSMAKEEMTTVCDLDDDMITRHKKKLIFYYGASDGWCPISYYNQVKNLMHGQQTYLDSNNISHSFVCNESEIMASILSKIILSNETAKSGNT